MTSKRKNHAFSLLFTLLVAGSVFMAYQFRDSDSSQGAPALDTSTQDTGTQDTGTQAEILLADEDASRLDGGSDGLDADRNQVAQPLPSESSADQGTALDQRSSAQQTDDGNLIVNGGFERPELAESGFATPPGWASRERELEFWADGNLGIGSDEGDQFIELNGRSAGRISQDIEVVPGETYRWSFSHRARNDQDTVKALIDGELVTDATSLPGQWRTASGLFVAQEGQDVITFVIEAVDEGEFGNFIDDVRFEVQPGL